jgi:hypothetical protein
VTKQRRYTSYARICVYLNISKPLPGSIDLEYQDEEWSQTIDYEHIPFHDVANAMSMDTCLGIVLLIIQASLDQITNEKTKDGFVTVPTKQGKAQGNKQQSDKNPKHQQFL